MIDKYDPVFSAALFTPGLNLQETRHAVLNAGLIGLTLRSNPAYAVTLSFQSSKTTSEPQNGRFVVQVTFRVKDNVEESGVSEISNQHNADSVVTYQLDVQTVGDKYLVTPSNLGSVRN